MPKKKRVNSRQKGKRGEREAANFLRSIGFEDARRTQQYNGEGLGDVICEESLPRVHIEVKYGYRDIDLGTQVLSDACRQAEADCPTDCVSWVVLWRPRNVICWRLTFEIEGRIVTVHESIDEWLRQLNANPV